jgi:hypothetical protein
VSSYSILAGNRTTRVSMFNEGLHASAVPRCVTLYNDRYAILPVARHHE